MLAMAERWFWRLTRRWWGRRVGRVLNRAYEDGVITSFAWHALAARFDVTQAPAREWEVRTFRKGA